MMNKEVAYDTDYTIQIIYISQTMWKEMFSEPMFRELRKNLESKSFQHHAGAI